MTPQRATSRPKGVFMTSVIAGFDFYPGVGKLIRKKDGMEYKIHEMLRPDFRDVELTHEDRKKLKDLCVEWRIYDDSSRMHSRIT